MTRKFNGKQKLYEEIKAIADQKACTPAQICLRWLLAQSDLIIPIPGSTRVEGVKEALDCLKVSLEERDLSQLREVVDKAVIRGGRYNGQSFFLLQVSGRGCMSIRTHAEAEFDIGVLL